MRMKFFACCFLIGLINSINGNILNRQKRGDDPNNFFTDLLSQLTQAIQKVSDALSGGNTGNDSPQVPTVQDLGFCKTNPNNCQYMACLAKNYQHSPEAANIKAGTIVINDPALRQAVINDPTISKAACAKANLTDSGCKNFKNFLGIVNVFDPASAHVDDEPRDKRSPFDDYENERHPPTKKPSPNVGGSKPYKPQNCDAIKREVIKLGKTDSNKDLLGG